MIDTLYQLVVIHLWQVTVAFGIVWLIGNFAFAKRRPHFMLLLWVLFLVKCIVPPVIQSPVSLMANLTPGSLAQSADPEPRSAATQLTDSSIDAASSRRLEQSQSQSNANAPIERFVARRRLLRSWLAGVWIVGSLIVFTGLAIHYIVVRRRMGAESNSDGSMPAASAGDAASLLRQLESQIGLPPGGVRLVVSQDSIGPLVFGFWRPKIVIPSELLDKNIPLQPILTHELCHVWRRDHLLGFLQMAVQTMLWFHPLVWMGSGRINRLCEICCDDDTLRLFGLSSKSYASGLLDVLALQRVVEPIRMAPGIRPVEITKQRIEMITSNEHAPGRRSQMIMMFAFLCMVLPSSVPSSQQAAEDQRVSDAERDAGSSESKVPAQSLAKYRKEMDFFLGDWDVTDATGQQLGRSRFEYEKSGNMIREDWTALDGSTAQGITFYDSNELCWKMTWVDSMGNFMESAGQWQGDSLILDGFLTARDGDRRKAQSVLSKRGSDQLIAEMRIARNGKLIKVSSSRYQRAN